MMRIMLKSKVFYAKVTDLQLYYRGSITIDEKIMEEANLKESEFMTLYKMACDEPYSFLHINFRSNDKNKRFRKQFNTILNTDQSL